MWRRGLPSKSSVLRWVSPRLLPSQQEVPAIAISSTTTTTSSSSSNWRPGVLKSLSKILYAVQQPRTEVPATASTTNQHKQRLTTMVSDYMGSSSGLNDTDSPVDPLEYWVKRLDIWSELSQYALELLSCPPSSVLLERCFSAAGGVVTEKRSRLSHASVDKLTFLKINQAWVEGSP
ncbi:zinc finger BED domain-containing protein 6-like [Hyperolius riggenbachi]|uniref:zinc finger BED domain-containing protein 6-like n=1 Tax=Hyperolius riggenbachi TaxID=752182 RepID=UPI0035A2CE0C